MDRTGKLLADLFDVCRSGTPDGLRRVLDSGARVKWVDNDNWNGLFYACIGNNCPMVSFLLLIHNFSPEERSITQETALHVAATHSDEDVVKTLLIYHASVEAKDVSGNTPLHHACMSGRPSVVQCLLKKVPEAVHITNCEGRTALFMACDRNRLDVIRILLDYGADPNQKDDQGNTLLEVVCRNWFDIAQMLLSEHALVNTVSNNGCTPLYEACARNYVQATRMLLEHEADVHGNGASVPLIVACERGHVNIVSLLLQFGANANAVQENGDSALCCASRAGHAQTARLLLQHGARLYLPGARSALEVASHSGHYYLLKYRANTLAGIGPVTQVLAGLAVMSVPAVTSLVLDHPGWLAFAGRLFLFFVTLLKITLKAGGTYIALLLTCFDHV